MRAEDGRESSRLFGACAAGFRVKSEKETKTKIGWKSLQKPPSPDEKKHGVVRWRLKVVVVEYCDKKREQIQSSTRANASRGA